MKSTELYENLFRSALDMILFINREGDIVDVNKAGEQLSVCSLAQLKTMNVYQDFVLKEDIPVLEKVMEELGKNNNQEFLIRWLNKDAQVLTLEGTSTPFFDSDGNFLLAQCILRDVTKSKQEEKLLAKSHDHLYLAFDAAKMGTFEWDIIENESRWSREILNILGVTPEGFGGNYEAYLEFIPKESRAEVDQHVFDFMKEGQDLDILQYEHQIIRGGGAIAWIEIRARLYKNKEGHPVLLSGIGIDITERKESENKIKESEQRYKTLANLAIEGIIIHQDGLLLEVNKAVTEITGYSKKELESIYSLVTPEYRDIVHENKINGNEEPYEIQIFMKNGLIADIELQTKNISYRGKDARVIFMRNIGKRKNAERKLRASEEKFRAITEQASEAITIADIDGNYTFVNKAFGTMVGYSQDELLDMTIFDIKKNVTEKNLFKEFQHKSTIGEVYLKHKDGSLVLCRISGKIINVENENFVLSILADITEEKKAERKLIEHKERLSLSVSASSLGIYDWDLAKNINKWNGKMFAMFGVPSSKKKNKQDYFLEIIHEEDKDLIASRFQDCFNPNSDIGTIESEYRVNVPPNGELKYIRTTGIIHRNKKGEVTRIIGTCLDITKEKKALAKVKENEAKFIDLYEQLQKINQVVKSIDDYSTKKIGVEYFQSVVNGLSKTLDANYTFIAKISKDLGVAKTQYLSIKGEDAENISYDLKDTPCSDVSKGAVCFFPEQIQQLFPDDFLLVEMEIEAYVGVPISVRNGDDDGGCILVALFTKPITNKDFYEHVLVVTAQRIQAEIERNALLDVVKENDIKYKKLFDNISDGMCILNEKGDVLHHNPAFSKILGYDDDDWESIRIPDIVHPNQYNKSRTQYSKLKKEGSYAAYETQIISKDKSEVWIQVNSTAIFDEDGVFIGSNDVIRDVTERKKAEIELFQTQKMLEETSRVAKVGGWEIDLLEQKMVWSEVTKQIYEVPIDYIPNWETAINFYEEGESRDFIEGIYDKAIKQGESYDVQVKLVTAENHKIWTRLIGFPEFRDGKCIRIYGTVQDITKSIEAEKERAQLMKEIQESEERYRSFISNSHEGVARLELNQPLDITIDFETQVDYLYDNLFFSECNDSWAKRYGYEKSENLVAKKMNEVWAEGEGKDIVQTFVRGGYLLDSQPSKEVMRDGSIKYFVGFAQAVIINNLLYRVWVTQIDVTEQKRLEDELERANEEEFAKLYHQQKIYSNQVEEKSKELNRFFELSSDMICIVNAEGVVQHLNPALVRTLGYKEEEILNQPMHKFLNSDDEDKTLAVIGQASENDGLISVVNRYNTKNGGSRWFSWHAIEDPDTGLRYGVARDITEERKSNKEIEDLKNTLDQIAIIIIIDNKRNIVSVNDKFCEASGYSREDVVGGHYNFLRSSYHSREYWLKLRRTISEGKIWRGEMKTEKKDGSFFWTDTYIVPFYDEMGNILQFIVIQSDITARKKLEKDLRQAEEIALNSAKIKEDFLANISHEIRTPMNAVLGFSRLLLQTDMGKQQSDYAQAIYGSAENLLVVVNDVLDFSKIESGKFELEKIEFNLLKNINDTLNILSTSIKAKNLELVLDLAENLPQYIIGAPNRIAQILINLLGNALKFTKTGHIKLSVKLKEDNLLLIEVADTGIGIPKEKLEIIFESFTQAENYTTRVYGGTGLGLSICQKLVSLMGGEIFVDSKMGEGSTFSFTVPFEVAVAPKKQELEQRKPLAQISINGANILVADDNILNQELMTIYLSLLDCNYDLVSNGQEALDLAMKNKYDLILMDIQMPIMDGLAATALIREQDQSTPMIAMTAHVLKKEKQKCFEIGMNDYLGKPFKKEELYEMIIRHISHEVDLVELAPKSKGEDNSDEISVELSISQLSEEVGGDEDLVKHMLLVFKDEVNNFFETLKKAMAEHDIDKIGVVAHKIKPNFELLQLHYLMKVAAEIEKLVQENAKEELIYKHCNEIIKYIPIVQLQIAEELV